MKNLPIDIRQAILSQKVDLSQLLEIRMRLSKQLLLTFGDYDKKLNIVVSKRHMNELLEFATKHSAYAYENQLKQGYITVEGGHRIGFCGKAIIKDGQVSGLKNISSVNIRIAHEIKGCAGKIMPYICNGTKIHSSLIIAPPGCGKTTILRDVICCIAQQYNVGVCDERGEIAAMYDGAACNDLGDKCDVLDGCNKSVAMEMLLRTMNPYVIAVDEIGFSDIESLGLVCNQGCSVIATIHGKDEKDILGRKRLRDLLRNFDRLIVLSKKNGVGTVDAIFELKGDLLDKDYTDFTNALVLLYDGTKLLQ